MAKLNNVDEIKILVHKVAELDERMENTLSAANEMHACYLKMGADAAEARARLYALGVRID